MAAEDHPDRSVSRRTMLKRIGAAGAIAWVTPVIASVHTPAYAAESSPTSTCDKPGSCDTGGFPECGDTTGGFGCFCFTVLGGSGACLQDAFCVDLQVCSSTVACPPGTVCAVSTGCDCGFDSGVCLSPCGSGEAKATGSDGAPPPPGQRVV